jgi:hypothetical protein
MSELEIARVRMRARAICRVGEEPAKLADLFAIIGPSDSDRISRQAPVVDIGIRRVLPNQVPTTQAHSPTWQD